VVLEVTIEPWEKSCQALYGLHLDGLRLDSSTPLENLAAKYFIIADGVSLPPDMVMTSAV
jgi:hypothetical protein